MDKPHRRFIASHLVNNDLKDKCYISYLGNLYSSDDPVKDFDESINDITDDTELNKLIPLTVDTLTHRDRNRHSIIHKHFFSDAYWNIVTEPLYKHNLCITEKTFKPIANLQPFVIVGGYKTLHHLKKLGFRTFGRWIDESYDLIEDDAPRLQAVAKVCDDLSKLSHDQHINLIKDMTSVLEHNKRHFFSPDAVKKNLTRILR